MDFAWSELDHVIFLCGPEAPEAEALIARGLSEGPPNAHPGQGTANRRFFFRNIYLELLWVENFAEAQLPEPRRVGLWDRWRRRGEVCPLGLVFRPGRRPLACPIDAWTYTPSYFPKGFSIEVANHVPEHEPLLYYLPFARPTRAGAGDPANPSRIGAVTRAVLRLPDTTVLSPALDSLVRANVIEVEPARGYGIDLHHVGGGSEVIDLRPALPLRFIPAPV